VENYKKKKKKKLNGEKIDFLLHLKNVGIEKGLQSFVCQINTELFKAIVLLKRGKEY